MCIRDRSYPFRYEGNGNQLFVFEAPIDLLSFICLYPQDWQKRNYLALVARSLAFAGNYFATVEEVRGIQECYLAILRMHHGAIRRKGDRKKGHQKAVCRTSLRTSAT